MHIESSITSDASYFASESNVMKFYDHRNVGAQNSAVGCDSSREWYDYHRSE